jgi:hypothetical protein
MTSDDSQFQSSELELPPDFDPGEYLSRTGRLIYTMRYLDHDWREIAEKLGIAVLDCPKQETGRNE